MSVIDDCEQMDHLLVEVMRFRDNILTFKHLEEELFYESWLRFKALLLQCPTHEVPDQVLLECFYRSLNFGSKGLIDQLIPGQSGKVVEKYRLVSRKTSWRIAKEVDDPDPDRRLDPQFNWRSYKTWRLAEWIGDHD
uniref:Uncharacterized protein n=1 Tax=Solanum tuberosum TaxID=4113 RepID=M1DHH8_SOLTU